MKINKLLVICLVFSMAGCSPLKSLFDESVEVALGSHKVSQGAFLYPAKGESFAEMPTVDPRNAMVYIYRPSSQWASEEFQSPSLFIDRQRFAGIKGGAYIWLELHAGEYTLSSRRPLAIFHMRHIFELPLEVHGGETFYFRYSEDNSLDMELLVADPERYVSDGPIQQVTQEIAMKEIYDTVADEPGAFFGGEYAVKENWTPFESFAATGSEAEGGVVEGEAAEVVASEE